MNHYELYSGSDGISCNNGTDPGGKDKVLANDGDGGEVLLEASLDE
jgi:hypothetical protein